MHYICSIYDAAKLAGVNESTIRRWIGEGRLIGHGRRKPWLVDLKAVELLRDTLVRGRPIK
jgi:transposase